MLLRQCARHNLWQLWTRLMTRLVEKRMNEIEWIWDLKWVYQEWKSDNL